MVSEHKLLAIVPAYNESKSVGKVIDDIRAACPDADVLVINDGSRDKTSEAARKNGVFVLDMPLNMGIGVAVQNGILYAAKKKYDMLVRLDGDGQHNPAHIKDLLRPISTGEADFVIGSRLLSSKGYRATGLRSFGITLLSTIVTIVTGQKFTDPTSGFHAMNRNAIEFFAEEYPPDYPEVESIILAKKAGLGIKEVPVVMNPRTAGVSSIDLYRGAYYMMEVFVSTFVGIFRKI